jgi:two-component system LytT family response regulator
MNTHPISIIVDDNPEAASQLRSSLASAYPACQVIDVGTTMHEGIELVMKYHPEVLFLDVELPDGSGFDLLDAVHEHVDWQMRVVFYTAYEKYCLQAIRANGFDVLLKPFTDDELDIVIKRLQSDTPQPAPSYPLNKEYFRINTPVGSKVFRIAHIGYFLYDSDARQWKVRVIASPDSIQTLSLRKQTDAAQILLGSGRFIQVNQSVIINIDYLCGIEESEVVLLPPFNDSPIKLSRKYKKSVTDAILWL